MCHITLFNILAYVQVLLQTAIVLNLSNVQWSIKHLIVPVTVIFFPHFIAFNVFFHDHTFSLESMMSWMLLTTLVYRISFKQSWRKSAFMAAGQYFLVGGFDYLSLFVINQMPDDIRFLVLENLFILRVIFTVIFASIFVYTKKFSNMRYSSLNHLIAKYWSFYLMFFLFFVIYDVIHMIEFMRFQYVDNLTEAFAVALFIVLFLHSMLYVRKDQHLEITQRELEILQLYANAQDKTLNDLRMSKHEFNGIINIIQEMASNGEISELNTLIEKITEPTPETIEVPENIKKIPILKGILAEKIVRAEIKRIKFDIEVMDGDIDLKYCSDLDYNRMIGILLDNAAEAAASSAHKLMKLKIYAENEMLKTIITNSCDCEVDISRIFERGYSTKSPAAGEGLYQISLYIDKYKKMSCPITIHTTFDYGYFTQILTI